MAKLNMESDNRIISTAATLLTLEISQRFRRNYKQYRSETTESASRRELIELCEKIQSLSFSLHNILSSSGYVLPFMLVLSRKISGNFDHLHSLLLLFDADHIHTLIPLIDEQRKVWRKSDQEDFYSIELDYYLEHTFPVALSEIGNKIGALPELS
jgi:hypothetical protein